MGKPRSARGGDIPSTFEIIKPEIVQMALIIYLGGRKPTLRLGHKEAVDISAVNLNACRYRRAGKGVASEYERQAPSFG